MDIVIGILIIAFALDLALAVLFLAGRLVVWFFLSKKGDQQ